LLYTLLSRSWGKPSASLLYALHSPEKFGRSGVFRARSAQAPIISQKNDMQFLEILGDTFVKNFANATCVLLFVFFFAMGVPTPLYKTASSKR
jgi:hypothetical protein